LHERLRRRVRQLEPSDGAPRAAGLALMEDTMHLARNGSANSKNRGARISTLLLTLALTSIGLTGCDELPAEEARVPAPREEALESNGDGTVTDDRTGLMWKACVEGLGGTDCATGAASLLDWGAALGAAESSTFAGYDDWRLPNVRELRSLAALDRASPAIDETLFPGTPADATWT